MVAIHILDVVGIIFLSSIALILFTILGIILGVMKKIGKTMKFFKNLTIGNVIDLIKSIGKKILNIKIFN